MSSHQQGRDDCLIHYITTHGVYLQFEVAQILHSLVDGRPAAMPLECNRTLDFISIFDHLSPFRRHLNSSVWGYHGFF